MSRLWPKDKSIEKSTTVVGICIIELGYWCACLLVLFQVWYCEGYSWRFLCAFPKSWSVYTYSFESCGESLFGVSTGVVTFYGASANSFRNLSCSCCIFCYFFFLQVHRSFSLPIVNRKVVCVIILSVLFPWKNYSTKKIVFAFVGCIKTRSHCLDTRGWSACW